MHLYASLTKPFCGNTLKSLATETNNAASIPYDASNPCAPGGLPKARQLSLVEESFHSSKA